jgi:recombination protein RecA
MTLNSDALKVASLINKKLGTNTVVLAGDMRPPKRITSGSLTLDVVLGGGWPLNNWVELVGEASHGKTAIALKTIAANQKLNPDFTTVWVAAEAFDSQYAKMCGVDTNRVLLVETNSMEDAFDSVIQFCQSKAVDLIVIDSLPALVPSTEDEKAMEEFTVGQGARLTNKFFRKVAAATKRDLIEDERPILGIMINQYRMKIGVLHGDPRTTPGGLGKDYSYTVRCEVKRDEWIEVGTGESKRRVGQTIRIRTIKNKTFAPQQTAYLDFYFAEGGVLPEGSYDSAKEIVSLALLNGIVDRRGGWMYYGDRKWQGAPALVDSLRGEIDLSEEISKAVLDTLKAENLSSIVKRSWAQAESDEE